MVPCYALLMVHLFLYIIEKSDLMHNLEIIIEDLENLKNSLNQEKEDNLIKISDYNEKINYYQKLIDVLKEMKETIEEVIESHSNVRRQVTESGQEKVLNLFDNSFKGYIDKKLIALTCERDQYVKMHKLSSLCYTYYKEMNDQLIKQNKEIDERILDVEMELSALNSQNIERGKTK